MLTNLDFLAPGAPWPPKGERKRLRRCRDNRKLFEGDHAEVFREIWVRLFRYEMQLSIEMCLNWPKRLSTLWADLLLGEAPGLFDGDNGSDYLEELAQRTSLWRKAYAAAIDCSRYGDAVIKVRRASDGEVKISPVSPVFWYPVVSEEDAQEIQYHVLAWPSERVNVFEQTSVFLYVEIHSAEKIVYRTYNMPAAYDILRGGTLGVITSEREEPNPDGRCLVVHIPNMQRSDSIFGLDDYSDLTSIMQELEVRFAQIARVLDAHADPKMYGPDNTTVDENGVVKANMGDYVPLQEGDIPPGYITWDGRLDMSFKQIETMMQQFYILSETSPAVFGEIQSGLAESGSALKRLFMAPLAKVNRVRLGFDEGLREVIKLAASLDGQKVEPRIAWRDGLPDDETERTQNEATAVGAGLTSKRSAMKRLYELSDEQADEEQRQIDGEKEALNDPDAPLDDEDGGGDE